MHKVELDARDIKSAPEMVGVNRGVKSLSFGLALLTAATVWLQTVCISFCSLLCRTSCFSTTACFSKYFRFKSVNRVSNPLSWLNEEHFHE